MDRIPTSGKTRTREQRDAPVPLATQDLADMAFPYAVLLPFDCAQPASFKKKLETGVKNGDCLPGCCAAVLESLRTGFISDEDKVPGAACMRQSIVQYIKGKWLDTATFNPHMPVHELMHFAHHLGITDEEQAVRGEWPEDPKERLAKYAGMANQLYFCDTELLMFASWVYESCGLPLCFRTWRNSSLISHTPDPSIMHSLGIDAAIIVDMDHTGEVDTLCAHYKILMSASLEGITKVREERSPRLFRLPSDDSSSSSSA